MKTVIVKLLICIGFWSFSAVAVAASVWIYVPSPKAQSNNHIDGDLCIKTTEIVDGVSARFPEKNTAIKLYCRSGSRACSHGSASKSRLYQGAKCGWHSRCKSRARRFSSQ